MWALLSSILAALISIATALVVEPGRLEELRTQADSKIAAAVGAWEPSETPLLTRHLPPFPLRSRLFLWERLAVLRGRFALVWAWPAVCLFVAVGAAAFAGRIQVAHGERIPSPALAHLAKRGAALAMAGTVFFIGLPLSVPLLGAPVCVLAAILLFGLYVNNLPHRL